MGRCRCLWMRYLTSTRSMISPICATLLIGVCVGVCVDSWVGRQLGGLMDVWCVCVRMCVCICTNHTQVRRNIGTQASTKYIRIDSHTHGHTCTTLPHAFTHTDVNIHSYSMIDEEMDQFEPDDYIASLPPVPAPSFTEGGILAQEYQRLVADPSSRLSAVDVRAYVCVRGMCLCSAVNT